MYLTEYEQKIYEWLRTQGIVESFPYIENGIEKTANSLEEIFYKAVFSYRTFSLVDKSRAYSPNDIRNISLILSYQNQMGAYYSTFQTKRTTITEEDIQGYSHEKVKGLLAKAYKKNRGLYYISSLKGYTSTTLYENPVREVLKGSNRPKKIRVYGRIQKVFPETLRLFDGTNVTFDYPFVLNGLEDKTDSIYRIYELAYLNSSNFEIVASRGVYSGQQKRVIKKLKELGGQVDG